MIVIQSFDVNKPGSEVDEIKGGVAGGSILTPQGELLHAPAASGSQDSRCREAGKSLKGRDTDVEHRVHADRGSSNCCEK
ncbi:hypothetical protein HHK36_012396 [Tetracentron sinense]|uniref:Uncharacterized protein n=1 Tax=Tetracentron sinense TaxID=13715 RepID=A0A834Z8D1_TETSI|nr:hypothetical protein HHK36_012396 [Tetracentron sinense]